MASSPKEGQQQQQQTVELSSLSVQQLSSVKKQLDEELEHLTNSFAKLRAAQTKFRECLKSIGQGVSAAVEGRQILVPLTTSLYVPGTIADTEKVIVDVGTGFYVEKSTKDATTFYDAKVEELGANLKDLESIVQGKSGNLRAVEDVLRQKVINSNPGGEKVASS
ncbi:MAG: subunit of tubulin prefoldin [Sclerophora amabilis]|nr:MAG: subunit of tubulin prefoldin [Sclerophora amabilis]